MAARVTVGVDIGTSSVKAVAVGDDGSVMARTRVPHHVGTPTPNSLQHDVDEAWRRGVNEAYAQVAAGADDHGASVAAVAVSAMVPSLAAVDSSGHGLTPGLLYGDERGLDPDGPTDADPASSGEVVRFLRWCAAQAPDAAGYWPAQAVANHALCGHGALDTVTAMTTVPLFDFTTWDAEVAASAGARVDQLPRLVSGSDPVGRTADGVVVAPSTIDAFAEQLVAGASEVGDVLVILGSTLIVWIVTDEWVEVPGLWTVPHTTPGLTLVGGASNAGGLFGSVVDRLIVTGSTTGSPAAAAADTALDPHDVPVWLPYVRGERVPVHDAHRRGSLHGISMTTSPAAVRRAASEASGFVVRQLLDLSSLSARRIVATGGGTHSASWVQALADGSGVPVHATAEPSNAARGAAWQARGAAGLDQSAGPESWVQWGATFDPDPAWTAATGERYALFRELSGV